MLKLADDRSGRGAACRRILTVSAVLAALLLLSRQVSWTQPRSNAEKQSRELLSRRYAGLDADFARTVPREDIKVLDYLNIPVQERTLAVDLREFKVVDHVFVDRSDRPTYLGHTCLAHYPGQHCPAPEQCPPADPLDLTAVDLIKARGQCVHWKQGRLPDVFPLMDSGFIESQRNRVRSTGIWDVDGHWEDDEWIPDKPNENSKEMYRYFTPQDMHQCLAGKRILMQGDSMNRQLFNRLITYSRHIPTIIEQYYGGTSVYTVYSNGTDHWQLWRDKNDDLYSRKHDSEQGVLYRVFYNFQSENLDDLDGAFEPLHKLEIDIGLLGFNYWYPLGFDFSKLPAALDRLWDSGWPGIISWYSAPQEFAERDAWWHVGQAALLRKIAEHRAGRDHRKIHIIPSDKIVVKADEQNYPQRNCRIEPDQTRNECLHDAHFGCGFLKLYDGDIEPGINGFKAPLGGDCRDIYNFAVLQNWLNAVCVV